jgi:hypothetical protein
LLFESIADPRTTHLMSVLGCLEEVVVCIVGCVGIWQTGTRGCLMSRVRLCLPLCKSVPMLGTERCSAFGHAR